MLPSEFCNGSVIAVNVLVQIQMFMIYANGCYYNQFNKWNKAEKISGRLRYQNGNPGVIILAKMGQSIQEWTK